MNKTLKALVELAKDISGKKAGMYDPDNHPDGARLKGFLAPAEAACDGTYFVGGKLTLADVAMFNSLQLISECAPDCLALCATAHACERLVTGRPAKASRRLRELKARSSRAPPATASKRSSSVTGLPICARV